ncbi:MAG: methylated-DNA--[protein]-cysteine S-methyltransferase [candidate division Zixibacteria bacterium]|nr:methylated-DNA--[protein]-cysteine S-methyltransferase [candidate division Zixibacteria bacterium]
MKKQLSIKEKYRIILDKDTSYEGIFFTAVKTTGIFCRPSCPARKPKIENVIFYDSVNEAILNGYRPCKVCKPMEQVDETPIYIQNILKELSENPYLKIKDYDLILRNIEPNKIRRWFKKHYNMTFQAYQRMLRINTAFNEISNGETVTHTAFDVGFESLSGFNSSYQKVFGKSATQTGKKNIINIVRFTTPLGPMFGCATTNGVCLVEFTNRKMLESEFKDITKKLNAVILPGKNNHLEQLEMEIVEYFKGKRKTFSVTLETPGTEFQKNVWKILQEIPYGETWSYQQQAIRLNKPKAVRAVASANGNNRISIIIPCHRVIGKDGNLTGYGGGLERKKWLIDFERSNQD